LFRSRADLFADEPHFLAGDRSGECLDHIRPARNEFAVHLRQSALGAGVACCAMSNQTDAARQRREGPLVQSVDRAVEILELLAREGWIGATDVARALEIHKSTAFRLLATLERHGLVEQSAQTSKYRLGARLPQLASAVTADLDLRRHAHPICERLAEQVGETVTLDLFENGDVVHIDQITRSSSVVSINWLGRRTPFHCTASGKVFLAFIPDDLGGRVLARKLKSYTPHTVIDHAELERQLEQIRKVGYGYTTEELEIGLNALAAPVRSADGQVIAAIDLSGPSHRLSVDGLAGFGELTRDAADEVSRRLGYRTE
jgi:DNA-binding IclR family transcriptional regulator